MNSVFIRSQFQLTGNAWSRNARDHISQYLLFVPFFVVVHKDARGGVNTSKSVHCLF